MVEQLLKFFTEVVNTAFKKDQAFFSLLMILYGTLALLFTNHPKINRCLSTLVLLIGIAMFSFVMINATVVSISNGMYSIQPVKCQKTATFEKLTLEIKRCNKSNIDINFEILITNSGKDKEFYISASETRLFDIFGNENHAQRVSIGGGREASYISTTIPDNIRIKASLAFEEVVLESDVISLLEIKTSETKIKFNNLILSE